MPANQDLEILARAEGPCPGCQGHGYTAPRTMTNIVTTVDCTRCKGTGIVSLHPWARVDCDDNAHTKHDSRYCSECFSKPDRRGWHTEHLITCPGYCAATEDEIDLEDVLVAIRDAQKLRSGTIEVKYATGFWSVEGSELYDTPRRAAIAAVRAAMKEK